jgi:TPR repeat protein
MNQSKGLHSLRILKIIFLFLLLVQNTSADEVDYTKWNSLYSKEKAGIRYYKKGDYKKAYEKLRFPAEVGLKEAQYYMGFMYLKGQHVNQSTGTGMAWLGVACESKIPDWQATFDQIYKALSPENQKSIDRNVSNYIQRYGLQTQEMKCNKASNVGSRKMTVNCRKAPTAAIQIESAD